MPDISQVIGFDVGSAITNLNSLNQSMDSTGARFLSLTQAIQAFNAISPNTAKLLQNIGARATGAAQGLTQLAQANAAFNLNNVNQGAQATQAQLAALAAVTQQTAGSVQGGVGRMTTSLQLLSRIVFTQAVIRGLRTIQAEVFEAGDKFVEFSKKSNVIAANSGFVQNAEQIRNEASRLAQAFNFPEEDVLNAKLFLTGTKFKEAADQTKIFTAAVELAKVKGAPLADTVKLISETLTAYDQDASKAANVAGIFNRNIDASDFKGFEAQIGRVNEVTGEFGFNLEDVTRVLDTLHDKGLKDREAMTQLLSILQAFLKPGANLKARLEDLGLDEAAIKAKGLIGTLETLLPTFKNAGEAAQVFGNARAARGIGALTVETFDGLTLAINKNRDAGVSAAKELNDAYSRVANDGVEQLTAKINAASTRFDNFIGAAVTHSKAAVFEVGESFGRGLEGLLFGVPKGLEAIGDSLRGPNEQTQRLQSILDSIHATNAQLIADDQKLAASKAAIGNASKELSDQLNGAITDANKAFNAAVSQSLESQKASLSVDKDNVRQLTKAFTDMGDLGFESIDKIDAKLEQLQPQIDAAGHKLDELKAKLKTLQATPLKQNQKLAPFEGLTDADFQRSISNQSRAQQARLTAAREARRELANEEAERKKQEAALKQQIADEKSKEAALQAEKDKLTQQKNAILDNVEKWKALGDAGKEASKEITDGLALIAKSSDPATAAKGLGLVEDGFRKLKAEGAQIDKSTLEKLPLSGADIQRILDAVGEQKIKVGIEVDANKAAAAADAGFNAFKAELTKQGVNLPSLSKVFGPATNKEQLISQLDEAQKKYASITIDIIKAGEANKAFQLHQQDAAVALEQFNALADKGANNINNPARVGTAAALNPTQLQLTNNALAQTHDALALLQDPTKQTKQNVEDAASALDTLEVRAQKAGLADQFKAAIIAGRAYIQILKEAQDAQANAGQLPQLRAQQQQLQSALGTNVTATIDVTAPLQQASAGLTTSVATTISATDALGGALFRLADQVNSVGLGQPLAFFGRPGGFAFGGITGRGMDRIHALLAPGESVINARSTAKFSSQVQALNAGRTPVFHQPSTSTTVGDIHVTVNTGARSVNGRQVAQVIQREIRRRTISG